MTRMETLLAAFKTYNIEVLSVYDAHVQLEKDYEIEVEENGMYKLSTEGSVLAPFSDIDAMCRFILI